MSLYSDMILLDITFIIFYQDLVIVLEAMRIIAVALSPITPSLCLRVYEQLGYTEEQFNAATWVFFSLSLLKFIPVHELLLYIPSFLLDLAF